ncbi:response regulator transcription factor [Streptomyces sp. NPDC096132]|uniref:response regulator transcription factor n=1 Tax=Streptomyces sp. NPDC096132 TaxID=3366075 RepID=UPI00382272A5
MTRRLLTRLAEGVAPPAVPASLEHLTSRERDVLLLVAEACTDTEIADRLGIGDETVKSHVSRILTKLNLRDRVQAVAYAHLHGLVKPASTRSPRLPTRRAPPATGAGAAPADRGPERERALVNR